MSSSLAAPDPAGNATPSWWPLVSAFAELSRELLAEHDEQALHDLICARVGRVLPTVEVCGITMRRRRGRLESVAATDPVAEQADQLQYELDEGPCVDAARDEDFELAPDVAVDPRWPSWGPRAAGLGIRSLVSVRLPSDTMHDRHQPLGALNLYSGRPGAFGAEDLAVARIYARHAANALASTRQVTGLQQATASRHLIGIAQGVLCQRYELEPDAAFDLLSRLSSQRNVKLRELAERVIDERAVPGDEPTPAVPLPRGDDPATGTADRLSIRSRLDPV